MWKSEWRFNYCQVEEPYHDTSDMVLSHKQWFLQPICDLLSKHTHFITSRQRREAKIDAVPGVY